MQFRLIEQETHSAAMNMAIEHAIYESVAAGKTLPTIRFYKWNPAAVSIGAYQNHNEIDFLECKKYKVGVVRRITGGRAVYHSQKDFTYSFIAPLKIFGYSINFAYKSICSCLINTLCELGIKGELKNKNDIMVNNKKISGNAAKLMDKGIYVQHGTIIWDLDLKIMPKVLRIDKNDVRAKATSISQHKKIEENYFYEKVKANFIKGKEIKKYGLSEEELKMARELAATKYNKLILDRSSNLKFKGPCYVMHGDSY